jgi:anion-transporting  ArsA/GET3 family ATPase
VTPKDLLQHDLVVCVGSGGVGKTTLAAALGVRGALEGRRVLVLTIDPARRLASALGLERFGNDEVRIALAHAPGELYAMMLDTRSTFDGVIERVSPDDATRRRIFENNIYRNIADSFASNHEYMATEKLYDVTRSGRYDLIVLDTPPVKNALDFLDAPGRLSRFLDRKIMKWFLTPYDEGRVFGRLLMGTSAVVYRLLGTLFGREFLADLSDFFLAFRELYDGFRERQESVVEQLRSRRTAFVVVGAPTVPSAEVSEFFLRELAERGMNVAAVVVNRLHPVHYPGLDAEEAMGERARSAARDLDPHTASTLVARLGAAHRRLVELAVHEDAVVARLERSVGTGAPLWRVPRLEQEVNDLPTLEALGRHLFE